MWATEVSYASAAVPSRSRRTNRCHDESSTPGPDGFIEEINRAGGPSLCDSPAEFAPLLGEVPWEELGQTMWNQVRAIIEKWGLRFWNRGRHPGRRPLFSTGTPTPTVTAWVRREKGVQVGLINIAREVHAYLLEQNIKGINVEILDMAYHDVPELWSCDSLCKVSRMWPEVGPEIKNRIDLQDIKSFGCYEIDHTPTILVTVDKNSQRCWKPTREAIIAVLDEFRLDMVAVIIRRDIQVRMKTGYWNSRRFDSYATNDDWHVTVDKLCPPVNPEPGFSIGPHGSEVKGGTLGGWVEIPNKDTGEWEPFGLTCSSCVLPEEKGIVDGVVHGPTPWNKNGVSPWDTDRDKLVVDCPSGEDLRTGIAEIEAKLEDDRDGIWDVDDWYWMVTSSRCRTRTQDPARLDMVQDVRKTDGHILGAVYAASGTKSIEDPKGRLARLDWALVQPGANRTPGLNKFTPPHKGSWSYRYENLSLHNKYSDPLRRLSLYKASRKTGYARVKYSHLQDCVIIDGVPTWESSFVTHDRQPIFQEGDMGAWLMANGRYSRETGNLVGMCIGGLESGDIGYFADAVDIFLDIQKVLGISPAQIRLRSPSGNSPCLAKGSYYTPDSEQYYDSPQRCEEEGSADTLFW